MATTLVELPGGEGMVRRDDGEIVLAHDVADGRGQPPQPWDRVAHFVTEDADLFEERPQVEVTTSTEKPRQGALAIARERLAHWVDGGVREQPTDGLSDAALHLWFSGMNRRRRAAAHAATAGETQITIDGGREPFATVASVSGRSRDDRAGADRGR
ncbi:MAG: hypothetical protein ACRDNS_16805 [Trebonia sp.]